jgi:hypothetical protein
VERKFLDEIPQSAGRAREVMSVEPVESFSSVVKRVLPVSGTLGAFLAFVERRTTATKPGNEVMEAAVKSGWPLPFDSETNLTRVDPSEKETPAKSRDVAGV